MFIVAFIAGFSKVHLANLGVQIKPGQAFFEYSLYLFYELPIPRPGFKITTCSATPRLPRLPRLGANRLSFDRRSFLFLDGSHCFCSYSVNDY